MSNRTTHRLPAMCACGRPKYHPCHQVPAPPPWWKRLLTLAWPSWTWGHTKDVHGYVDRAELGATREQLRRLKRDVERQRRKAAGCS